MRTPEYWQTVEGLRLLADANSILIKIGTYHGNAKPTNSQVISFAESLRRDYTMEDAIDAVTAFYAKDDKGRWMQVGDVNKGIGTLRKERIPSSRQIGELMGRHDLDDIQSFRYRQALIRSIGRGRSLEQADTEALDSARRRVIEPARTEPKPRQGGHFIGSGMGRLGALNLDDTIGDTK